MSKLVLSVLPYQFEPNPIITVKKNKMIDLIYIYIYYTLKER